MSDALHILNISYAIRGKPILTDINVAVKKGTISGILGPNGAGKSTLLSLITDLRKPTAGQIILFEKQHPGMKEVKRRIGVVLQETALYEDISVYENLAFAALS